MKRNFAALISVSVLLLSLFFPAQAFSTLFDLNDFFADPSVTVAPDGSTATIAEDPLLGTVLLVNDPFFGDPNVIIPMPGMELLMFEYDFVEGGAGNFDEFGAFVFDSDTGLSLGNEFEFFTPASGAGTVIFDLSAFVGLSTPVLGLQFQLAALPGDAAFNSIVTVSNVQLAPIPEPATLILVGVGLAGLCGYRRRQKSRKQTRLPV